MSNRTEGKEKTKIRRNNKENNENLYAIEGKLYPSKSQISKLNQTFGCVRYVYNHYVWEFLNPKFTETEEIVKLKNGKEGKKRIYEKSLTLGELKKQEDKKFLREVDSLALCNARINFTNSKNDFLRQDKKELTKRAKKKVEKNPDYQVKLTDYKGCPRFKRKHDEQSFTTNNQKSGKNGNTIELIFSREDLKKAYLKIPKIGLIKVSLNREVNSDCKIKSVTVRKLRTEEFYCSVLIEDVKFKSNKKEKARNTNKEVGIDLGIKTYLTDSDGKKVENPKFIRKTEKKLKKQQRNLSRKFTEGEKSKNYEKNRIRVSKIHEKIKNQRKDFHHKLSNKYINENQVIYLEDLNVQGMMQNHKLAKSIQDCGWSAFVEMLTYKAEWSGREIVRVSRFYPSSKTCTHCGYKNTELTLSDRFWDCPQCGSHLDRDANAAVNILKEGQKIKYSEKEYRRDDGNLSLWHYGSLEPLKQETGSFSCQ